MANDCPSSTATAETTGAGAPGKILWVSRADEPWTASTSLWVSSPDSTVTRALPLSNGAKSSTRAVSPGA
jgi:hypothetical protein